jgi:hypothetical protein
MLVPLVQATYSPLCPTLSCSFFYDLTVNSLVSLYSTRRLNLPAELFALIVIYLPYSSDRLHSAGCYPRFRGTTLQEAYISINIIIFVRNPSTVLWRFSKTRQTLQKLPAYMLQNQRTLLASVIFAARILCNFP